MLSGSTDQPIYATIPDDQPVELVTITIDTHGVMNGMQIIDPSCLLCEQQVLDTRPHFLNLELYIAVDLARFALQKITTPSSHPRYDDAALPGLNIQHVQAVQSYPVLHDGHYYHLGCLLKHEGFYSASATAQLARDRSSMHGTQINPLYQSSAQGITRVNLNYISANQLGAVYAQPFAHCRNDQHLGVIANTYGYGDATPSEYADVPLFISQHNTYMPLAPVSLADTYMSVRTQGDGSHYGEITTHGVDGGYMRPAAFAEPSYLMTQGIDKRGQYFVPDMLSETDTDATLAETSFSATPAANYLSILVDQTLSRRYQPSQPYIYSPTAEIPLFNVHRSQTTAYHLLDRAGRAAGYLDPAAMRSTNLGYHQLFRTPLEYTTPRDTSAPIYAIPAISADAPVNIVEILQILDRAYQVPRSITVSPDTIVGVSHRHRFTRKHLIWLVIAIIILIILAIVLAVLLPMFLGGSKNSQPTAVTNTPGNSPNNTTAIPTQIANTTIPTAQGPTTVVQFISSATGMSTQASTRFISTVTQSLPAGTTTATPISTAALTATITNLLSTSGIPATQSTISSLTSAVQTALSSTGSTQLSNPTTIATIATTIASTLAGTSTIVTPTNIVSTAAPTFYLSSSGTITVVRTTTAGTTTTTTIVASVSCRVNPLQAQCPPICRTDPTNPACPR